MKQRVNFDSTIKDLIQRDRPSLLTQLSGGIAIRAFLNVELPKVQDRKLDLVLLLEDGSILHIEIQSTHDSEIAYRMLDYYSLLKRRYKRPTRQVLLYVGEGKLHMPDRIAEDGNLVRWTVLDIREIDASVLLETANPGDIALAILAGGGDSRIPEILKCASRLKGPARERLLTQIVLLAVLRGTAGRVQSEMKHMSVIIDIRKHPFLMKIQMDALKEGKAEGKTEGKSEALTEMLKEQLEAKFGPLPRGAKSRIADADIPQLKRWVRKVLTASTIEGVLGKPR
jgi:predicted transposase YdaD